MVRHELIMQQVSRAQPATYGRTALEAVTYLLRVRTLSLVPKQCSQCLWFLLWAKPTRTLPETDSEQAPLMSRA